jgi:hypothetical protein
MTRTMPRLLIAVALAASSSIVASDTGATEAVAGRYIPGAFAGPGMGIVPPMPGAYWAIENVY